MSYYPYQYVGRRRRPYVPHGTTINVNAMEKDPKTKRITWPDDWMKLTQDERDHLLETEQIPPVAPSFWDPGDPATWVNFDPLPSYLLKPPPPLFIHEEVGEEISYAPVFELYSIKIISLDGEQQKKFNKILLRCINTDDIPVLIYKRGGGKEEDITSGQPLPLKGPDYLPSGEWNILIVLNYASYATWAFEFDPIPQGFDRIPEFEYGKPLFTECPDAFDESVAQVSYEIIKDAVRAHLQFHFIPPPQQQGGEFEEEEEERTIRILEGTIFATHKENTKTKRIVKQLSSLEKPLVVVLPNIVFPVDRYVFGVPMGSKFQVTVEKLICTTNLGDERGEQGPSCFQMSGTLDLDVPTRSRLEHHEFKSTGDVKLGLTVSWSNPNT